MPKVPLEKSLEYLKPNVAKQWHPTKNNGLTPKDFTSESNKMSWWKCLICDYEWCAAINKRGKAAECPNCKIRSIEYKDSLNYINPELSKSWHHQLNGKLTPEHVKPHSTRKVWWQLAIGHEKGHPIIQLPFCLSMYLLLFVFWCRITILPNYRTFLRR